MSVTPVKRRMSRRFAVLAMALATASAALQGCASLTGTALARVQGREVEFIAARHAGPAVVFENGLGGTVDWWARVWPEIAREHSALAYNRPGYGRSQAADDAFDGQQVVERLRALLQAQQMPPPYVLVGHSLGGLYMQLYARSHPAEVAALVMVDSTHPEQLRGQGAPEHWPAATRIAFNALGSDTARREFATIDATGQRVLAWPAPPPEVAVWVLSARRPMSDRSALADDANAKRAALADLYPGARQVWVDSGHGIPLERPEAVIAAIREAIQARQAAR